MILGIGIDVLDIRRIEKTIARFGSRFVDRVFTDRERVKAGRRANPAAAYAQCYAAKEASSKALGTGFRRGVFWRDMAVESLPSGKPFLVLTGGAKKHLEELTPSVIEAQIDLSLSDDAQLAQAVVLISAVPQS